MLAGTFTRNQALRGMAILTCAALIVMLSPALSSAQSASITTDKTVGLDPMACAATSSITLPPEGGEVTYCYTVTNTGDVTFTTLSLGDDHLGTILSSFPYSLGPGASVFITQAAAVTVTTTNVASWTAEVAGTPVVTSVDSALVTVTPAAPGLSLVKTVGTDPAACAPTGAIVLPPGGGTVVYCYRATNTGNVTFTSHTLADSELGTLLNDFAYALGALGVGVPHLVGADHPDHRQHRELDRGVGLSHHDHHGRRRGPGDGRGAASTPSTWSRRSGPIRAPARRPTRSRSLRAEVRSSTATTSPTPAM